MDFFWPDVQTKQQQQKTTSKSEDQNEQVKPCYCSIPIIYVLYT